MILCQKIKIFPNFETQQILWSISALCKDLWNVALEQRRDPKSWGKVDVYTQKKELPLLKKEFVEFQKPSSQVLQNVLFSLDRAYKQFFTKHKQGDKEARPPRFKSYKQFFTQEYSQYRTSFLTEGNLLKLAYGKSKKEWLVIPLSSALEREAKTVHLKKEGKDFFACFTQEVEEKPLKESGETIWFDPGCKTTLTGIKSTGEFLEYDLNPLRRVNKETYLKIDTWVSLRDKLTKGSKRWRKYHQKIKSAFKKLRNRTRSYLHSLGKVLLEEHQEVLHFEIGNWKKGETKANTENKVVNKQINRAVQNNNPLETLINYLSYKAKRKGQVVARFNESGTSRTCVKCGLKKAEGISPQVRVFRCERCQFSYPRDHHSCLNFIKKFDSVLWQCLSGNLPDRTTRTTLNPFSLKPQRVNRSILNTGCSSFQ